MEKNIPFRLHPVDRKRDKNKIMDNILRLIDLSSNFQRFQTVENNMLNWIGLKKLAYIIEKYHCSRRRYFPTSNFDWKRRKKSDDGLTLKHARFHERLELFEDPCLRR